MIIILRRLSIACCRPRVHSATAVLYLYTRFCSCVRVRACVRVRVCVRTATTGREYKRHRHHHRHFPYFYTPLLTFFVGILYTLYVRARSRVPADTKNTFDGGGGTHYRVFYYIYFIISSPYAAAAARTGKIIIMRFRFMRSRLRCAHSARLHAAHDHTTARHSHRDHFNDGVPGPRRQMPIKCVYVLKSFARDTEGMLDIFGLHGGGLGIVYVVVVAYARGVSLYCAPIPTYDT